jgi:hypothetical protein
MVERVIIGGSFIEHEVPGKEVFKMLTNVTITKPPLT